MLVLQIGLAKLAREQKRSACMSSLGPGAIAGKSRRQRRIDATLLVLLPRQHADVMRHRSTLRRWTRKFDSKVTLQDRKTSFHGRESVVPSQFIQRLPTRVYRHFKVRCAHA